MDRNKFNLIGNSSYKSNLGVKISFVVLVLVTFLTAFLSERQILEVNRLLLLALPPSFDLTQIHKLLFNRALDLPIIRILNSVLLGLQCMIIVQCVYELRTVLNSAIQEYKGRKGEWAYLLFMAVLGVLVLYFALWFLGWLVFDLISLVLN
ncbi:hypothetical protein [Vibrio harveyi]|uniref:hypothetical protein n=1 Tax=Vibrio harveyi TaxID=669 RepID=UPI000841BFA1|nr:hypothetical protein [Vibrio harveyi]